MFFSNIVNRLFKNDKGIMIVSIILGLGIASLFKKTCVGDGCIIIKTLPVSDIQEKTYRFDNKCYKYDAYSSKCKKSAIKII